MRDPVARYDEEGDYKNYELAEHPREDPWQKGRSLLVGYRRYREADHHERHGKGKYPVGKRFYSGFPDPFIGLRTLIGHIIDQVFGGFSI